MLKMRLFRLILVTLLLPSYFLKSSVLFVNANWKTDWKKFAGGVLRISSINVTVVKKILCFELFHHYAGNLFSTHSTRQ